MADDDRANGVMAVIRAARPSFRNKHDKVAFAVHATFLNSGYYLTAAGPPAYEDDALTSSSTEEVGIDRWNELEDEYGFVYANAKDPKKVLVKCLAMNNKLVVEALKHGASGPLHIEIDVDDFAVEDSRGNYSDQYKNLEKLVKEVDKEILTQFHASSKSSSAAAPTSSTTESSGRPRNINEPGVGVAEPWGPQIHSPGVVLPPVYAGGYSDVYPGPPPGSYPTRGGFIGDGGMLIGPNDPRFFGSGDRLPPFSGVPPPGVPPGARFDPYGPPDIPDFDPSRFMRNPPRRPGGGGGGGIHPDLQHLPGRPDFGGGGGGFHPDLPRFPDRSDFI